LAPVTFDNFAKAVEAFEATLITPAARFDQFLEGDATALTAEEKDGLRLFMDKGCSSCHKGIYVGGKLFPVRRGREAHRRIGTRAAIAPALAEFSPPASFQARRCG
jgi:cytochrome c peroxidase